MGDGTRSRASRADGERTRERILEVALPMFAERGFAGTSIRMLATEAGVNVATLAYHFSDKQGLYDTVVQRLHEDLMTGWPLDGLASAPDPVAWVVDTAWSFAGTHRTHVRLLMRHVLDAQALPDVVADRWSEPLLQRAEALVATFRPDWTQADRRMLVLGTMHMLVRLILEDRGQLAAMLGHPSDVDGAVRGWLERFLRRELGLPEHPR